MKNNKYCLKNNDGELNFIFHAFFIKNGAYQLHCNIFLLLFILASIIAPLNIVLADCRIQSGPNKIFEAPPANPSEEIIELIGRYVNIMDKKDNFLIFENEKTLKILIGESVYPALKINDGKYICIKNERNDENIIEFIKLYSFISKNIHSQDYKNGNHRSKFSGNTAHFKSIHSVFCKFDEKLYRKITYDTENGGIYKIKPIKAIDELRKTALLSCPPHENDINRSPELINLRNFNCGFKFDIRYASNNNFMGEKFYESPEAYLQKPAAYSLLYVARALLRHGLGIIIYDAYRPWHVTKMFYDATADEQKNFVADPSKGSRHNRGTAVDIGLYDLSGGAVIDMGSGYDEFSERAYPSYPGGTDYNRWHRELLQYYMNKAGFTVYEYEWWHFDYKPGILKYPLLNVKFKDIKNMEH